MQQDARSSILPICRNPVAEKKENLWTNVCSFGAAPTPASYVISELFAEQNVQGCVGK